MSRVEGMQPVVAVINKDVHEAKSVWMGQGETDGVTRKEVLCARLCTTILCTNHSPRPAWRRRFKCAQIGRSNQTNLIIEDDDDSGLRSKLIGYEWKIQVVHNSKTLEHSLLSAVMTHNKSVIREDLINTAYTKDALTRMLSEPVIFLTLCHPGQSLVASSRSGKMNLQLMSRFPLARRTFFSVIWIIFMFPKGGIFPISLARATIPESSIADYSLAEGQQLAGGFPIARLYVAIPEELPPGSTITDLSNNPVVKNLLSNSNGFQDNDAFHYRLINTFDSRLFRVGAATGRVTPATRLDREALCASQKAQFCCNSRAALPVSLMTDPNWKQDDELPKNQLCHLVAHISLQLKADSAKQTGLGDHGDIGTGNRVALIYLYIRLDDINDHTPQFSSQSNSLNVMEDTPVGSTLYYFRVSDPDAGSNSLRDVAIRVVPLSSSNSQTGTLLNADDLTLYKNPFSVQLNRDGVSLSLSNGLDRETVPAYDVTLTAMDGDKIKPRSSQMNIRIHITDVNDNAPVWVHQKAGFKKGTSPSLSSESFDPKSPRFNVSVPEDTPIGALIFWLQARDADNGDNARLQYGIDTTAPGGLAALDFISVQAATGEVRLRSQLDYDTTSGQLNGPEIEVPVVVKDSPRGGRQLSATATLVVNIMDVNDIHPIIVANPLTPEPLRQNFQHNAFGESQQPLSFIVWENRPPGQPIASILVSDPDTGSGGKVTCNVQSDYFKLASESTKNSYYASYPGSELQNLETSTEGYSGPVTYQLVSTQRLDREEIGRHQVILTCKDHDHTRPLVSTRRLHIEVLDENDNPPTFSASVIHLSCPENSPPGQLIGKLNATDKDIGENARLRFWIEEADASWASIHSQTGEVRINTVFDREVEAERQFTAYVKDSADSKAHTASVQVKVAILDVNDHSPHFTDLYFFSVPENSPPGTEVGYVRAEDEDEGDNGKVRYFLRQPSREFELDKDSGRLSVRSSRIDGPNLGPTDFLKNMVTTLDREQQDTYELTVLAEDGGVPPRSATTVVHVGLSDINDHAPEFRYPTPHGPGSVLNISCAQLSSQVIARVYANDSDTGQNGEIEYSIVRIPHATIRPKRTPKPGIEPSAQEVNVGVTQLNMTGITGTKELRNKANLTANASQESKLAKGDSAAANSRQVKSAPSSTDILLGGPTEEHFEINSYNGQVFLIHPILDCSRPADVRLVIQAKDGGDPAQSSTATLMIHVHPTERNSEQTLPIHHVTGAEFGPDAFSANHPPYPNPWTSKSGDVKRTHRKYASAGSGSSGYFLSGTSHWSAIIGLIVAMVVLVLLLCLMLVILRRRFTIDSHKGPVKGEPNVNASTDKLRMVGTIVRPGSGNEGIYFKGPRSAQSFRELSMNSTHLNSLSPSSLTPAEELQCATVNIAPNQHYFCTLPSSSSTAALNSGEVAVLHRESASPSRTARKRGLDNSLGFGAGDQVIYKSPNGDLYGYVEPHLGRELLKRGNTYQTLQRNQRKMNSMDHQDSFITDTFRANTGECFRRNIFVDSYIPTKSTNYTPLLDVFGNGEQSLPKSIQSSQPDLCKKANPPGRDQHSTTDSAQKPLLSSDRTLSLSDLTSSRKRSGSKNAGEHSKLGTTTTEDIQLLPRIDSDTVTGQGKQDKHVKKTLCSMLTDTQPDQRLNSGTGNVYSSASFV
ncbi:unnamed protein product [Calicophoron daubneyi]|uniref:Cadherin domain-containing protein n=1 Tax=Calicophoron daubneyi TaxID=300641 RepID=A0AAV2TZA1_CALDB